MRRHPPGFEFPFIVMDFSRRLDTPREIGQLSKM
jgi:hypothetical protein